MDGVRRLRVVLFGDSLTQRSFAPGGWGARVADASVRRADVINRGYSGYNTRWAACVVESVFPTAAPPSTAADLVTIFFGANDAVLPGLPGDASRQHVPVAEYEERLSAFVQRAQKANRERTTVALISPPPVDEPARLIYQKEQYPDSCTGMNERTTEHAAVYAEACKRVAEKHACVFVDTHAAFLAKKGEEFSALFDDGLHFTAAGNKTVYNALAAALSEGAPLLWYNLTHDDAPYDFPWNKDIDAKDPDAAFAAHT